MRMKLAGSSFAAALLSAAPEAQAVTIQVTYTGTIQTYQQGSTNDGIDYSGLFGTAGASIAGQSYQQTYNILVGAQDYSQFSLQNFAIGAYNPSAQVPADVNGNPVTSVSTTINSLTYTTNLSSIGDSAVFQGRNGNTFDPYLFSTFSIAVNFGRNNPDYYSGAVYDTAANSAAFLPLATSQTSYSYTTPDPSQTFVQMNIGGEWLLADVSQVSVTLNTAPGPMPGAGLLGLGISILAGLTAKAQGLARRWA
jgi:hypothetical protein